MEAEDVLEEISKETEDMSYLDEDTSYINACEKLALREETWKSLCQREQRSGPHGTELLCYVKRQLMHCAFTDHAREFVSLYYNTECDSVCTLSDVAQELGISREQARAIRTKILHRLCARFGVHYPPST